MLDQFTIQEWFEYCPKNGKLFWKKVPGKRSDLFGQEAGCTHKHRENKTYYREIKFQQSMYRAHVLIWILHYGTLPEGFEPDHIDHNGLNNLIDNLRLVTCLNNNHNKPIRSDNTSGYTGVYRFRNSWKSEITVNKKRIYLGCFKDITMAINTKKAAEIKYGFHENHGK